MEYTIDCGAIHSKEEFHRVLSETLHFPAYYGNNLDALYDCLTSISETTHLTLQNWDHIVPFARGFKFVFDNAELENPNLFINIQ